MIRVLLVGEGATELGDWASEVAYRNRQRRGVLEALLELASVAHRVDDALLWRQIRKYKAGGHRDAETRNVLGAALFAKERGLVLVFSRDRDGDEDRQRSIDAAVGEAAEKGWHVAGGVAVEAIEAWILALLGDASCERRRDPKQVLKSRGVSGREQMVDVIDGAASIASTPSASLDRWMASVRSMVS